ncbi:MAG: cell division ATPase MinD [Candidatus Hadarchaeota archaeon]
MRTIIVGSGKGGVGRSTITANLGLALAELGFSTLIIDGSLTSPTQALFFNLEGVSIYLNDILSNDLPIEEAIYDGSNENLKILPASLSLDEMRRTRSSKLPEMIKQKIKGFDYVIIDAPSGLRKETISVLKSGEELILITTPEPTAISDSIKTKLTGEFLGLTPIGVILNKVEGESYELDGEEISELLDLPVLSVIPKDDGVGRSLNEGDLLLKRIPRSPASRKIKKISRELSGRRKKVLLDEETEESEVSSKEYPVADAGGPYSVDAGEAIKLEGKEVGNTDFDDLFYTWSIDHDPTGKAELKNENTSEPVFKAPDSKSEERVTLEFKVENEFGFEDVDTATIKIRPVEKSGLMSGFLKSVGLGK